MTSSVSHIAIPRRELFYVWRSEKFLMMKNAAVLNYLCGRLGIVEESDVGTTILSSEIKRQVKNLTGKFEKKWLKHQRTESRFLSKEGNWIDQNETFPLPSSSSSLVQSGRPLKKSKLKKTISCGLSTNIQAFRAYAKQTAELAIKLYPWYYMPPSEHRLLIHGADIIEAATLPIGMLSEEALESRNKDLRRYRERNTRKTSRVAKITDLWHSLLFPSDPLISTIYGARCAPPKARNASPALYEEMKTLLLLPSQEAIEEDSERDDSSEEEHF